MIRKVPGPRVRIIGGRWRGRKLPVADVPGLRPTPDRVRETVFNWLQPVIEGAHCLDLFAGTGALSLEALSRGADQVVLVERDSRVVAQLHENARRLDAQGARIVHADGLDYLNSTPRSFDIAFLDPPYRRELLELCCRRLEEGGWVAAGAQVYLEAGQPVGAEMLPSNWRLIHSKRAGQVCYHLAVREAPAA